MKKSYLVLIPLIIQFSFSQSVEIKDTDDQLLLQINDEGDIKSSITIPNSDSAPTSTASKLYNEGGNLKWNGSSLATGSSLWSLNGSDVYRSSGNVGIGTTNPLSKLSIGGDGFVASVIYSETDASDGRGVNGVATGISGRGVAGFATNTGTGVNYGGYFQAEGSSGSGVYGQATGYNGKGVYGYASNTGAIGNFGGFFTCAGGAGKGVYGKASNTDATVSTYGGYFESAGSAGIGVYGKATKTGIVENYGGYFEAQGHVGRGVYGIASYTGTSTNYGGHFTGMGIGGIGVYGFGAGFAGFFDGKGYFSNNVGIGTKNPVTNLHINGDEGILGQGTYGNGVIQNLGAGTRLHFYPKKSAFRAGYVNGAQWDDSNIGEHSTAMGANTTAAGYVSTALGDQSNAQGNWATAIGYHNTAIGEGAIAMGVETVASGDASTTLGRLTKAESSFSTVLGKYNVGGGNAAGWTLTDPIFEIGIGTSDIARNNAVTVLKNGNTGIGTTTPNSKLSIVGLSEYTNNAAAIIAGLAAGDLYRTGDLLKIVH